MAFDSYFSSVVLLLKGEGSDGSTTIQDSSVYVRGATSLGAAQISTSAAYAGLSSIYLNGGVGSSYLEYPPSTDFDVGSGDFTFECWIRRHAVTDATYADQIISPAEDVKGFTVCVTPAGKLAFNVSSTGSSWDVRLGSDPGGPAGSTTIPLDTWTHVALVRSGSSWYGFVNGLLDQTFTSSASVSITTGAWRIGRGSASLARYFNGYIDNLRFTKGVARYTSGFDPTGIAYDPYGVSAVVPSFAVSAYTGPQANVSAPPAVVYGGELRSATIAISAPAPQVTSSSGAVVAATLPSPTVSSAAHSSYGDNALIFTAPSFSLSSFGGANATAALPMPTVSFTATGTALATVAAQAPAATLTATGTASEVASLAVTAPMVNLVGYGGVVCSVTTPVATVAVSGTGGATVGVAVTLPMFEVVASVTAQNYGSVIVEAPAARMATGLQAYVLAPMAQLVAVGTATVAATYEAYALNLKHTRPPQPGEQQVDEMTHYTNFPFTHIIRHQNSYYGVNGTGLYLLEGTTDNGVAISYEARTHITDFNETRHKTLVSAYIGGRLGASSTVTLYVGDGTPKPYSFTTPRGAAAQNYRQRFGLGIKHRYFALGIAGSKELSVDTFDFDTATMTRRI